MSPLQVLLKWQDGDDWFVIRRGLAGDGFYLEGYTSNSTGKSIRPEFSMPVLESEVIEFFKKQGKEWRIN